MYLQTPRLILRKLHGGDFKDFCAYSMDDEMSRMMGRPLLHSEQDARSLFHWLLDKEERCYALIDRQTGRMIGNLTVCAVPKELIALAPLRGKSGRSISFCIGRAYRRQGLMEEAVRAVIDRLFEEERLDYLHCGCFAFNEASKRLQEKLGFQHLTSVRLSLPEGEAEAMENVLFSPNH